MCMECVTYDNVYGMCYLWPCVWSVLLMTMCMESVTYDNVYGGCFLWQCVWSVLLMTMCMECVTYDNVHEVCYLWQCAFLSRSQRCLAPYDIVGHPTNVSTA